MFAHRVLLSPDAQLRGVGIVLDAKLKPEAKIKLAPKLLNGVESNDPRDGLAAASRRQRASFEGDDLETYDAMTRRIDQTIVAAVGTAFRDALLITAALAVLAGLALLGSRATRRIVVTLATLLVGAGAVTAQGAVYRRERPRPAEIANPCKKRDLPGAGGITGFFQDQALKLLDRSACNLHVSREELVLALADDQERKAFEKAHGTDPRSVGGIVTALFG